VVSRGVVCNEHKPCSTPDRVTQPPQNGDLPAEFVYPLLDQLRGHIALPGADRTAKGEPGEWLDLVQPEAQVFQGKRGVDIAAVLTRVFPGAPWRPPRLRQDAELLVVPDRAAADPGDPGELTDADQARSVVAYPRRHPAPPLLALPPAPGSPPVS
jgi:hypothetical protein